MNGKKGIWVYKHDGSIQCDETPGISLGEMRKELEGLIGEDNVLDAQAQSITVAMMCGLPTGVINTYQITPEGWWVLIHGVRGPEGFSIFNQHRLSEIENIKPDSVNQIAQMMTSAGTNPIFVRELIGKLSRVYQKGDALTEDFIVERVNIELVGSTINNIWFG